jgi:hypothetical protein
MQLSTSISRQKQLNPCLLKHCITLGSSWSRWWPFVTPVNERSASPGLCTRYILSLKDNRMGTGSSICSAIMKCRNYSGIVIQDWTRLWKSLRCVIYLYILARHWLTALRLPPDLCGWMTLMWWRKQSSSCTRNCLSWFRPCLIAVPTRMDHW